MERPVCRLMAAGWCDSHVVAFSRQVLCGVPAKPLPSEDAISIVTKGVLAIVARGGAIRKADHDGEAAQRAKIDPGRFESMERWLRQAIFFNRLPALLCVSLRTRL